MTNLFDITEFGAVGDGVTDCTTAIQRALDKAGEVHGCVTVPPGVYACGRLTMRAHTRIEGKSGWSFRKNGLSTLKLNDAGAKCLLDITGAFGCAVSGLCLEGCSLGESVHGVYLYWERYNGGGEEDTPTIDDCRIGGFSGNGVHLEHVWCFSIRHSMLCGNLGAGLFVDGWDAFIIDNWFSGNQNCGILGGKCSSSITATGNRVEWNVGAGFKLSKGDAINITGNYFDRTFGPALWLGGQTDRLNDITITGNIFRRNGCQDGQKFASVYQSSHIYLQGAVSVSVVGNSLKSWIGDNGTGSRSPDYGMVVENSDCVVITSNVMKEASNKQGIVHDDTHEVLIRDNLQ